AGEVGALREAAGQGRYGVHTGVDDGDRLAVAAAEVGRAGQVADTEATRGAHLRRGGRVELDRGVGGDAATRGGERGGLARRRVGDGDTVGQQRDVARADLPGCLRGVRPDHDDAVGVHGA